LEFQTFDSVYLNKLRSSDEPTQRHFADYFGELIALKLRSRLQSREAIEDVKQETFARFFALLRKDGGIREAERGEHNTVVESLIDMNHDDAIREMAVEKYLLGELAGDSFALGRSPAAK
jgi:hypothetical protein